MIAGVRLHDDIRPVIDYMVASRDQEGRLRPEVVALGGPAGYDLDVVEGIFSTLAAARPNIRRPLASAWLSLAPGDRRLSDREWRDAASRVTAAFGADAWATWRHGDDHVHVVWSRLRLDRSVVDHRHDYERCEAAVRQIEQALGLETIISSPLFDPARPRRAQRSSDEDVIAQARCATAWRTWQDSSDARGDFERQLDAHGLCLELDEVGRFCLNLAAGRIRPLASVLAREARRKGVRPPRDRDVADRLSGITAEALVPDRIRDDVLILASDSPPSRTTQDDSEREGVIRSMTADPPSLDISMADGPSLVPGGWSPAVRDTLPHLVPDATHQRQEDATAERNRRAKAEAERMRKHLLARRIAELTQILEFLATSNDVPIDEDEDQMQHDADELTRETEHRKREMQRDLSASVTRAFPGCSSMSWPRRAGPAP